MTLKASTGLRNKMLDSESLKEALALGFIRIYDGPVPLTADAGLDAANHLLLTISVNGGGTGLTLATTASGGAITKNGDTWKGTTVTPGTASFYRFVEPTDNGTTSTTFRRLQGTVGTSGADLNMTTITIADATEYPIDAYSVSLPTA